jgi:MFS family permease
VLRSALWRHRDYRRLWGAQGVSALGSQITLVALPFAAILTLHATTFEVAVLTALEFLPFVFLGIPAGVWVDRMRHRPILVVTDLLRGASLLSIPIAYTLGILTLGQLYAVALVNGSLTVFFTLAYQALLPSLLERKNLVEANATFEATETAARLAGPGAGGALVGILSAPVAVLADAVSFFVSGALVFSMRHHERVPAGAPAPRGAFWSELREGGRFALRDAYARSLLATTAIVNVGFNMAWAVLLVFAVRELGLAAAIAGLLLSAGEVGGLIGAFAATRLARRLGVGRLIIGSAALFAPSLLLLAVAPANAPIPFLVLGWSIASFASVLYNTTTVSVRQAYVPERLQARVVGFNRTIVWGVSPFGALLGGALATAAGLRVAIAVGAAVALMAVLPALLSPLRSLRELPEARELEPPREPDPVGHLPATAPITPRRARRA